MFKYLHDLDSEPLTSFSGPVTSFLFFTLKTEDTDFYVSLRNRNIINY